MMTTPSLETKNVFFKDVSMLEKQLLSSTLNQIKGPSSSQVQKLKMGGHSLMNVNRGTMEPKKSMAGKNLSNPETTMGLPKS